MTVEDGGDHLQKNLTTSLGAKRFLVTTAGNNTTLVVQTGAWFNGEWDATTWTNEGPLLYDWATYTGGIIAVQLKAGASDASPVTWFAPQGWQSFDNLVVDTIDGGSVQIYVA